VVLGEVLKNNVLRSRLVSCSRANGEFFGKLVSYLSIGANLGFFLAILLSGNRPVNKEEINVVKLQTLERVVDGPEDVIVTVQMVPDLCGHEDVGTLDGGIGLEEITDTLTDLILVPVEPGTIEVTVAYVKSSGNGVVSLALGALTGESAEANGGHLNAIAQSKCFSGRHCEYDCV
jgi:hypothetical protein